MRSVTARSPIPFAEIQGDGRVGEVQCADREGAGQGERIGGGESETHERRREAEGRRREGGLGVHTGEAEAQRAVSRGMIGRAAADERDSLCRSQAAA